MPKKEFALGEDVLYTIAEVASLLKVNKNMVYCIMRCPAATGARTQRPRCAEGTAGEMPSLSELKISSKQG